MDRTEYTDKMLHLLSDNTTYRPTHKNKNPTPSLIQKFNKHLQNLLQHNEIDKYTYNSLISYNSQAPRGYGLPKIHKPNNPLRPIISNINSPSSKLSKFLLPTLQVLSHQNPYDINNSLELKNEIKSLKIPPNFILASLDAESLFTNIPIDRALQIVEQNWPTIQSHTKLSRSSFLESLSLCCKSGYLLFQGTYYHQLSGLAMGNCLAPDISNITLNDLLNLVLPQFPHDILILKKYVDDLFLIINPEKIPDILNAFNSYHPRLKFTIETESNNSLPFLDLLLIRNPDGSISTDWYTKPTYSGRLLHYLSSHPSHQIINTAKNLIHRSLTLSDPKFHEKNKSRLLDILQSNGFPSHTIRNLIHSFENPKTKPTSQETNSYQFRSLPYIPNLSEKIQKSLRNTFPNLKLGLSTQNKLKHIYTSLKDPIPLEDRSHSVYRIPCSTPNCNSTYIGQTKNPVKNRINTHKYNIKNKDIKTALARHAITDGHNFDFEKFSILSTESNLEKRLLSESIYIHLEENPINDKIDKEYISSTYSNIFHILKTNR